MKYEIDFLPVGNGDKSGDAIALRYEDTDGTYKVMVIDGGTKESGELLVKHINKYYDTNKVDYVINTHPDQDHASGLSVVLEKMEVGELWIHRPWLHTKQIIDHFHDGRITESSLAKRFQEDGFKFAYNLEEIANKKNVTIREPYEGCQIGIFRVLSPNKDWYLYSLIPDMNKTPKKAVADGIFASLSESVHRIYESLNIETLKEDGETSADNESSVVLYSTINSNGFLFTGDVGIEGLNKAVAYASSISIDIPSSLKFIQVPHHGSRRNVAPSVLDKILGNKGQEKNKTAFISAGKESSKHPRKVVINAFIRRGCKVYQTKGNTICHSSGVNRTGWNSIIELEISNEVENYD